MTSCTVNLPSVPLAASPGFRLSGWLLSFCLLFCAASPVAAVPVSKPSATPGSASAKKATPAPAKKPKTRQVKSKKSKPASALAPAKHKVSRATDLALRSASALVVDQSSGAALYARNVREAVPIASITKLMTAMVLLDAKLDMHEILTISDADVDRVKGSSSRLRIGTKWTRQELLGLALMASENRAASAMARTYPGGTDAFVAAMNKKARELTMRHTQFVDPTGLHRANVATAEDLVKLVNAGYSYAPIRWHTTTGSIDRQAEAGQHASFRNTNALVRSSAWDIGLSKTGFIREAGRCLVMQARIARRKVVIILLDAPDSAMRTADAHKIKKWLEATQGWPASAS